MFFVKYFFHTTSYKIKREQETDWLVSTSADLTCSLCFLIKKTRFKSVLFFIILSLHYKYNIKNVFCQALFLFLKLFFSEVRHLRFFTDDGEVREQTDFTKEKIYFYLISSTIISVLGFFLSKNLNK